MLRWPFRYRNGGNYRICRWPCHGDRGHGTGVGLRADAWHL